MRLERDESDFRNRTTRGQYFDGKRIWKYCAKVFDSSYSMEKSVQKKLLILCNNNDIMFLS